MWWFAVVGLLVGRVVVCGVAVNGDADGVAVVSDAVSVAVVIDAVGGVAVGGVE